MIARELVFSRPITKQSKGKTKAKYEIPYCSISRKTSAVIGQSRSVGKISFPGYLVVFMKCRLGNKRTGSELKLSLTSLTMKIEVVIYR